jgi:hypothetical protein
MMQMTSTVMPADTGITGRDGTDLLAFLDERYEFANETM